MSSSCLRMVGSVSVEPGVSSVSGIPGIDSVSGTVDSVRSQERRGTLDVRRACTNRACASSRSARNERHSRAVRGVCGNFFQDSCSIGQSIAGIEEGGRLGNRTLVRLKLQKNVMGNAHLGSEDRLLLICSESLHGKRIWFCRNP